MRQPGNNLLKIRVREDEMQFYGKSGRSRIILCREDISLLCGFVRFIGRTIWETWWSFRFCTLLLFGTRVTLRSAFRGLLILTVWVALARGIVAWRVVREIVIVARHDAFVDGVKRVDNSMNRSDLVFATRVACLLLSRNWRNSRPSSERQHVQLRTKPTRASGASEVASFLCWTSLSLITPGTVGTKVMLNCTYLISRSFLYQNPDEAWSAFGVVLRRNIKNILAPTKVRISKLRNPGLPTLKQSVADVNSRPAVSRSHDQQWKHFSEVKNAKDLKPQST